jgi:hypothetical protein
MSVVPLQRFFSQIGSSLSCVALFPSAVFGALLIAVFAVPFPAVLARPFFMFGMLAAVSPISFDQTRLVVLEIGLLISFSDYKRMLMFPTRTAFGRGLDASSARQADAVMAVSFTPGGCFGCGF